MEFKKFKEIGHEIGLTSLFCETINDKIILYGGSNFPKGTPPNGMRVTHKDMYIYDTNFNLISKKIGDIAPDRGICLKADNEIYLEQVILKYINTILKTMNYKKMKYMI